jgi:hypothetical protein
MLLLQYQVPNEVESLLVELKFEVSFSLIWGTNGEIFISAFRGPFLRTLRHKLLKFQSHLLTLPMPSFVTQNFDG